MKRGRWTYEPLGVVAVLGPATEPFATPLSGARIGRVFARAGLPEGLLGVTQGHTDVGTALVSARQVAQVRFTGSTRAGRQVGEACARGLKRSVLELGGKDAALVLADANLVRASAGIAWA